MLTDTQLKLLDTLTDKSIKKWSGLPPSATNALTQMSVGLGIKSISELYTEVHTLSHTRTRLKGVAVVNSAIDATIARESAYTRKKSTCIESEERLQTALTACTAMGEIPEFTGENATSSKLKFDSQVSKSVKSALSVENREHWENHVKELAVQGHYLELASAEKQDIVWKSFMYNLKQGTLKFLLNAAIDTLPTAANLVRWKKSASDLCKLCKKTPNNRTCSQWMQSCIGYR